MTHHPDCDGWRTDHPSTVERTRHERTSTYRAVCQECGPLHVGSFGEAAKGVADKIAAGHAQEVPCDGRCLAWDAFPGLAAAIDWQSDRYEEG